MAPYSGYGKFIRENPEATSDFVAAIAKAANWVNANPDEARKIVSQRIGTKLELVERYAYVDDLIVTEPPIQYYIDILQNEKKIKPGAVSVKDVYTNEFNALAKAQA
jgi:ABC-type nitrate/sulfonate/bicarbonate transport system substrate-binding protein